jgi:hypothetical protein
MAVAWPMSVNQKAYGMDTSPGENVERVEFESGKARTFLKNSVSKKVHSFMLDFEDVGDSSEYKDFLTWWNDDLASGSLSFLFPDLINHDADKEYRSVDGTFSATGQRIKTVSLTVEEM